MPKPKRNRVVQRTLFGDEVATTAPATPMIPLEFERFMVRVIMIQGQPWWVLSDLAKTLGYRDASDASRRLTSKNLHTHWMRTGDAKREFLMTNESGLYRLIMRSNKPEAEKFQDWITEQVLPEIRRTGRYDSRGGRVAREAKRLNASAETAKIRCDQFAVNKLTNAELAETGACPNDFRGLHNAVYKGQFDATAPELREKLGLKSHVSPLDRMGTIPMIANMHAKAIGFEKLRGLGPNLPAHAREQIMEETAREMAVADMERLGPGYFIGLKDDPKRGKIIDVVRNEIAITGEAS